MKVVQTKAITSASPAAQVENTGIPFFARGGTRDFFHSKTTDQPFFSKSPGALASKAGVNGGATGRGASIQAKLTVGKPNDPYEKQADAMADKVVQRLSEKPASIQKKDIRTAKPGQPAIQAKCSECEKEEKLQKKEDSKEAPKEAPKKILRKAIFESNEDKSVQRKAEPIPVVQKKQAPVPPKAAPVAPVSAPVVQAKCSACEQEEKIQEKEDDVDNDAGPGIQKKPIFESNAEPTEEKIQRSCRECEEGNEVLLKPEGVVQRDATHQEASGDGSRESILAMAKGELGKVQSKQNDGSGRRVGADRLLEYFHIAAPGVWDDSIIETAGAEMPSWCGIFSVWAHKKAGKDIGNWEMGKGVSAFGTLTETDNPQPGDIGYIHKTNQHHCIVERIDGDTVHTIDGNSGAFGEVIENARPRSKFDLFLTAFGGGASGTVQAKEEGSDGIVQAKSGDSVASPSVEQKISSTKGKGNSLPESTRSGMEENFGADFSNVKVHTDSSAVQMSKDLHAQAFTHGSDIYFNSGKYNTGSTSGQHLLAHELTHVVQQGSAPANIVNRAAEVDAPSPEEQERIATMTPEELDAEIREDLNSDDMGGSGQPEAGDEQEGQQPGEAPVPNAEDSEGDPAEIPDQADEENAEDEPEPSIPRPDGSHDTVPDNTPVDGQKDECPNIVPEFPRPPAGPMRDEGDDGFWGDVMQVVASVGAGGIVGVIGRVAGIAAYRAWRALPEWVKVRAINIILDRAISGAAMTVIFGRYSQNNIGWLGAAMKGFFQRIREMPDTQKIIMFEKFGRIILRGDFNFMFGMLKGLLMGFFVDGLLGIIQMVIDVVCLVPKVINFFNAISDFLRQATFEIELIKNSISEMMSRVGDVLNNVLDEIMDFMKHPERVLEILDNIYNSGARAAENIGREMANGFIRYAALPSAALGEIVGRIGGMALFEAVLIYFTGPGGAGVTTAKILIRAIGKGLLTVGTHIFTLLKYLGRALKFIKGMITGIIKFLTPLMKALARMARTVIDRISGLFRMFRKNCRPGSPKIKCKLPDPVCKGRRIPRQGGNRRHDAYVNRTTHTRKDYRMSATVFGIPIPCNFDALMATRVLVEGKTGYRGLPFIQATRPDLFRVIMFRFNEQRWRCGAIATRCGYPYVWFMEHEPPATFLGIRWHGIPPVFHVP